MKAQGLKNNVLLKLVGRLGSVAIPITSAVLLGMLMFGPWAFTDKHCFAVEFPDTNLYDKNPTSVDPKNYIGL